VHDEPGCERVSVGVSLSNNLWYTETMVNLRINTQNIKFSLSLADFTHDLDQALVDADVLLLQECAGDARQALIASYTSKGWASYLPHADHVQKNNPIMWKHERFELTDFGSILLHRSTLFRSANRNINWVELKDKLTGRTYTIGDFHSIPNVDSGDGLPKLVPGTNHPYPRHPLYVTEMQIITEWANLKRLKGAVFIGGDWNVKLERDFFWKSPDFPTARMGAANLKFTWELTNTWPDTHGKNSYDGLCLTYAKNYLKVTSASRITNTKSDHEGTSHNIDVVPVAVDLVAVATKNGLQNADILFNEAAKVGVPFYVACSFANQESNGANIYGHDKEVDGHARPFWGHGVVTEANYKEYLIERNMFKDTIGYRAQGVGPGQLTWYGIQDRADAAGGCWKVDVNIRTMLEILKEYHDSETGTDLEKWQGAALKYNGKAVYVTQVTEKLARWKKLVG
jgi:hypothetical protein